MEPPRYRADVLAYVVAIVVAIVVIPLTNGSVTRLAEVRFRRVWLLVAGLALQIALEVVDMAPARYDDVGVAILLVSYVALLGFCASNLRTRGIELIGLGIALNAIVIALNLGMPYKVADGLPRETTVKHRPTRDSDVAVFLSDQIVFGDPVDAAISIGDIVLAAGIVELAYFGSRRPRRRGRTAATREIDLTTIDEIDLRDAPSHSEAPGRSSGPARSTVLDSGSGPEAVVPQPTGAVDTTRSKASNTRRS